MKYQAIQHLKTTCKQLKMCDSLEEAKTLILSLGARYEGRSYVGGFPTFSKENKRFSIQGAAFVSDDDFVVCSLPDKEVEIVFSNQ